MNSLKEIAALAIIKHKWLKSGIRTKRLISSADPIPLDVFKFMVSLLIERYGPYYGNCFKLELLDSRVLTNKRLSPSGNYVWVELNNDGHTRLISVVDYVQRGFNLEKSTIASGLFPKVLTHRLYQKYIQHRTPRAATNLVKHQYLPVISPYDNFTLYFDPFDGKYYLDNFGSTPSAKMISDKADMHYVVNDQFVVLESNPNNGTPSYLYQWVPKGLKLISLIASHNFHIIYLLAHLKNKLTTELAKMLTNNAVAKVLIDLLKLPRVITNIDKHIFKISTKFNFLLAYTRYLRSTISFSVLINLRSLFNDALNNQVSSPNSYILPYPRWAIRTSIWDNKKDRLVSVGRYNGKIFLVKRNLEKNIFRCLLKYPDLGYKYPIDIIAQKTVLSIDEDNRYLAIARHIGNTVVWIYALPKLKLKYILQLDFGTFKFYRNWALINIPRQNKKVKVVIKDGQGSVLKQQIIKNGLHLLNFENLTIRILMPPLWACNSLERIEDPGHFPHYFKFGSNRIISRFDKTKYIIDYRSGVLSKVLGIPNLPPILTDQQFDQIVLSYYKWNIGGN